MGRRKCCTLAVSGRRNIPAMTYQGTLVGRGSGRDALPLEARQHVRWSGPVYRLRWWMHSGASGVACLERVCGCAAPDAPECVYDQRGAATDVTIGRSAAVRAGARPLRACSLFNDAGNRSKRLSRRDRERYWRLRGSVGVSFERPEVAFFGKFNDFRECERPLKEPCRKILRRAFALL